MIINNKILGNNLYFRCLDKNDVSQEYCAWLNDPKVNKYLDTKKATIQEMEDYINKKNEKSDCLFLGIFINDSNKHIGNLKLEPINIKNKTAQFSIMIGNKSYWGKGHGTEATKMICAYAFKHMQLKKINLGTFIKNEKAMSIYRKLGFKTKKIIRNYKEVNSIPHDSAFMEMSKQEKDICFLIVGCGSIGKRHIRNLLYLGYKNIVACETSKDVLQEIKTEFEDSVKVSDSFDEALAMSDAVLICTPNHLHTKFVLDALKKNKHVFVEKPLAHTLDDLDKVEKLINEKDVTFQVGFNLRHHLLLQKTKKLLDSGDIGKVLHATLDSGSYLPNWRPGKDYSKNYAAKESTGGGIIFENTHELDYAEWFFGKPVSIYCSAKKISDLDIETEDTADIMLTTELGIPITIHLDYLQEPSTRTFRIVGNKGILKGNLNNNTLETLKQTFTSFEQDASVFDYNVTYVSEILEFINCIQEKKNPTTGFKEGLSSLKIALAAKKSSATHQELVL